MIKYNHQERKVTSLDNYHSRGISKAGVVVESLNAEQSTSAEVSTLMQRCCGFVIGSPTLGGHMPTPIQVYICAILNTREYLLGKTLKHPTEKKLTI